MANNCFGLIAAKGRKEKVDEFIEILKQDYNYNTKELGPHKHMYRIFEAEVEHEEMNGLIKTAYVFVDCAWSFYSCMRDGRGSYYRTGTNLRGKRDNETVEEYLEYINNILLRKKHSTHLVEASEDLHLTIEYVSNEPNIGFAEHFIVDSGIIKLDDEQPYSEIFTDEIEYDRFKSMYPLYDISKEEYENYEVIYPEAQPYSYDQFTYIRDVDMYPIKVNMCKIVDNSKPRKDGD